MAEDAFLTQIVTQETRENNILDLVFASDPDLIRDLKVAEKNYLVVITILFVSTSK